MINTVANISLVLIYIIKNVKGATQQLQQYQ